MTANKPMTGEQLDELMTVAVNMQRDAETDCNRPSAMFAYAVQVAVLELRKVRNDAAALAAENAGLKCIQTWAVAGVFKSGAKQFESTKAAGFDTDDCLHDAVLVMLSELKTPATDAFQAELWAQGVEMLRDSIAEIEVGIEDTIDLHHYCSDFAAEVRKGVQS